MGPGRALPPSEDMLSVLGAVMRLGAFNEPDEAGVELVRTLAALIGVERARLDAIVYVDDAARLRPVAEATGQYARRLEESGPGDRLPRLETRPDIAACAASGRPSESGTSGRVLTLVPVPAEGHCRAVISLHSPEPLDAGWRQVVAELAAVYGNHVRALELAQLDTLTGLHNRRSFESRFWLRRTARELAGAGRWLGMVDIDNFKEVNDRFGHLFGDEVLRRVAQAIRSAVRPSDRVFRFGGEEFAVLLERVPDDDAHEAFERLRRAIENHDIPRLGRLTVSIGYTPIDEGERPEEAYGRADRALYLAKSGGRNRCLRFRP